MGGLCPDKGFGIGVVVRNVVVDGGGELGDTFEDTATNSLGGNFSEPTFNKIEPLRRSWNKMQVKAGMPGKPTLDAWMLVRRIIVGDAVNIQLLRRCPVNRFQEFEELLMTVPRHTLADNLAFENIERGKSCCRAIALVIMRHRYRTALLHRQAGLCAIKGLDLAFLVNTKHQGVFRRDEVKTDDILQLLNEMSIVG